MKSNRLQNTVLTFQWLHLISFNPLELFWLHYKIVLFSVDEICCNLNKKIKNLPTISAVLTESGWIALTFFFFSPPRSANCEKAFFNIKKTHRIFHSSQMEKRHFKELLLYFYLTFTLPKCPHVNLSKAAWHSCTSSILDLNKIIMEKCFYFK